jgi:hypothetical protein
VHWKKILEVAKAEDFLMATTSRTPAQRQAGQLKTILETLSQILADSSGVRLYLAAG